VQLEPAVKAMKLIESLSVMDSQRDIDAAHLPAVFDLQ
jgi:hypothetical protein